ncbi:conserved hypothetical protein [Magnetospirillum sp. LM-5]|uniref:NAD-dependent epimerase/dehydratase family protein n=1 Tax=Magnetospirillum sp. LM-5 TaxID=2681466 RepID=UPI00137EE7FB|nr:NAD-dependent epimerase/dehydratase family protein [Magnetospirillum sp. LM-5]CAA7615900.1 conserved hypothetical protein [Magnetospirillum sp. LM-5]
MPRPVLLFGAGGNLGSALHRRLTSEAASVTALPWSMLKDSPPLPLAGVEACDIVFANGLTDSGAPPEALDEANHAGPCRLVEATMGNPAIRYLTIGTVMEHAERMEATNAYVASKTRLAQRLRAMLPPQRHLHVRLHTLYGGRPAPHMFLGQMIAALATGQSFRMSAGTQWREYHHVDDIAAALAHLLAMEWSFPAGLDLSSGDAIRLRELAQAAFARFAILDRLQIGALLHPEAEENRASLPRSPEALLGGSRKALDGVLDWIGSVLKAS